MNNLPGLYQELEYIESTGTQWIDTGINADNNLGLDLKLLYGYGRFGSLGNNAARHHLYDNGRYGYGNNSIQLGNFHQINDIYSIQCNYLNDGLYKENNLLITTLQTNTFDTNYNYHLFSRNSGPSDKISFNGRIYYCKLSYNSTLVRNFIPAKRTTDNVVGMYDTVSQTFFTNSGTGTFIAGPAVYDAGMKLKLKDNPKIEFKNTIIGAQANGTSYINTGYYPNNNTKVECSFKLNRVQSLDGIFGAEITNQRGFSVAIAESLNAFNFYVNDNVLKISANIQSNTIYNISVSLTDFIVNGVTTHIGRTTSYTVPTPFLLYCFNRAGSPQCRSIITLYYFKIYENNVLLHDLIPYIDSNNVICWYDKISKVYLYTNAGTFSGEYETFSSKFKSNLSNLFHKNCPNINGWSLVNTMYNYQLQQDVINLHRIRLDIGNASGTYADLIKFKDFGGFKDTLGTDFNDTTQHTAYPALYGTYTVTNDIFQDDLDKLEELFPTLTIACSGTLLDWNDLAVQTLDSTKPNYNPAVAIILNNQGIGTLYDTPPIRSDYGRYYLTKTEASSLGNYIGSSGCFKNKTSVSDDNHIVSNTTISYNFNKFNEFQFFTGDDLQRNSANSSNGYFSNCSNLTEITLPPNRTRLGNIDCTNNGFFQNCTSLVIIHNLGNFSVLTKSCLRNTHVTNPDFSNITTITENNGTSRPHYDGSLYQAVLGNVELPKVTWIGAGSFSQLNANYVHIGSASVPTLADVNAFNSTTFPIYVGDGSSQAHDEAILADYSTATNWSTLYNAGRIKTWWEHEN